MADDLQSAVDQAFQSASARHNVDERWLRAIAQTESGGRLDAVSPAGAVGLMQIMPDTARRLGIDPHDPAQAIDGAARILDENLRRYGNPEDAMRAYNAGTDRARWDNEQTRAYPGKVMANMAEIAKKQSARKLPDVLDDSVYGWDEVGKANAGPVLDDSIYGWHEKPAQTKGGTPSQAEPQSGSAPEYQRHNWQMNALTGLVQGARDVGDSGLSGANWLLSHAGVNALQPAVDHETASRAQFDRDYSGSTAGGLGRIAGNIAVTAPIGGGLLGAGVRAGAAGARALGMSAAAGRLAGALLGNAAAGAGSNLATNSRTDESAARSAADGAALGIATGALGAVMRPVAQHLADTVTGGTISRSRAELARLANEKYGIGLTAPQISDSQGMKYLATGAAGGMTTPEQLGQFTRAVSRTFGEDSPALTPDVIDRAHINLGQRFDDVANRTSIVADPQFHEDIAAIQRDAPQVLTPEEMAPVSNQIANVLGHIPQSGIIMGSQYQALTRHGTPLALAMRSRNPNIAFYAGRVRDALDDAMERSLTATGNTDVLDDLRDARFQYKNLKTIEPLAAKANEDGAISPALLQGAVSRTFKNRARKGAADLGELAQIGQSFLKNQPNSGTPGRLEALGALSAIPAAAMTGSWEIPASIVGTAAMRGATRAVLDSNPLANSVIRRGLRQGYSENALTQGLRIAGSGLPYAATIPGADLFLRNALTGYGR